MAIEQLQESAEAVIYTHVVKQGGGGTKSPLDCL